MTKQELTILFAYDEWAMERTLTVVSALSPDHYKKDLGTSHGSIHATLVHAIAASRMWLDRLSGNADSVMLKESDVAGLSELRALRKAWRADMEAYLEAATDASLQEQFSHTTSKGITYTYPRGQLLQHLVNHTTYHRGQVVAMLRQMNAKPVNCDFIYYLRTLQNQ